VCREAGLLDLLGVHVVRESRALPTADVLDVLFVQFV
jgi:hypothetical protein